MLNYVQNQNYSDYIHNEENLNKEILYLQVLDKQKDSINYKNKINIYEENSKFINSRKILKLKTNYLSLKQNTFDKDINRNRNRKIILNNNNENKNKINATIKENECCENKTIHNILLNAKNKIKDGEKYLKFKKDIFEKASKLLHDKASLIKDINSKIKKIKSMNKKLSLRNPLKIKTLLNNEKDEKESISYNKESINIKNKEKIKVENDIKINTINKINKSLKLDINNFKTNISKNISYKFNDNIPEEGYYYFDISKIKSNPQIPKEYLNIIYRNLLIEEDKGCTPYPDYYKIKMQKEINEDMRSILIDWIIDVHYKFNFTDETLFMTISIIDRYISYKHIPKISFQLLGITALLISCKHEEIILPKIDDFIYITDNAYTKNDVFKMENDILDALNFELIIPSGIKFYEYLALKFDFNEKKFLMGKYLMESFMINIKWVKYRASIIAISCVYIVMKYYKMNNYKESYNKKYYNLDGNDINNPKYRDESIIKECAKNICIFVDNINKTNYLSCKNKYATEKNKYVSLILSGERVE